MCVCLCVCFVVVAYLHVQILAIRGDKLIAATSSLKNTPMLICFDRAEEGDIILNLETLLEDAKED